MRSITKGALVALLTGTILVTVGGTASAGEGRGTGTKSSTESTKGAKSSNSANSGCGEYCSTRDGSPSRNGNGGGKATGRPEAGSVGKADNKNPKGQYRNGSDSNNGYECDGNNGIAKGNPAHTGCTASAPVSPVAPAPAPAPAPVVSVPQAPVVAPDTTPVVPEAPAKVLGVKFVAPAKNGTAVVSPASKVAPQVLGTRFTRTSTAPAALPFTGGMTLELVFAALALVIAGVAATRLGVRAGR
jgi:hypothetical protein